MAWKDFRHFPFDSLLPSRRERWCFRPLLSPWPHVLEKKDTTTISLTQRRQFSPLLLPLRFFFLFTDWSTCDFALLIASLSTDVMCSPIVQSSPPNWANLKKGPPMPVSSSMSTTNAQNQLQVHLTIALVRWYATYVRFAFHGIKLRRRRVTYIKRETHAINVACIGLIRVWTQSCDSPHRSNDNAPPFTMSGYVKKLRRQMVLVATCPLWPESPCDWSTPRLDTLPA